MITWLLGGALAGLSVHMIDLIAWLGGPVKQVMAQAKRSRLLASRLRATNVSAGGPIMHPALEGVIGLVILMIRLIPASSRR